MDKLKKAILNTKLTDVFTQGIYIATNSLVAFMKFMACF